MPITYTDRNNVTMVKHLGEVVKVRRFKADRNHSDTLDYTDIRVTDCTEALVYVGRVAKGGYHARTDGIGRRIASYQEGEALAPIDRFQWVDCTNLFVWRGCDNLSPRVDDIFHPDVVIDYVEYLEARNLAEANAAEENRRRREDEEKRLAEREKHRPVVGKRMVVVSGRKVRVGTEGTVAHVHDSGRVLLKDDAVWRDRKADGVWVDGRHLRARV